MFLYKYAILWLKDMFVLYSKQQRFISRQFLCVSLFIFQHRFPSLVKGVALKMPCIRFAGSNPARCTQGRKPLIFVIIIFVTIIFVTIINYWKKLIRHCYHISRHTMWTSYDALDDGSSESLIWSVNSVGRVCVLWAQSRGFEPRTDHVDNASSTCIIHQYPSLVKGVALKMPCFVLRGFKSRLV
mgnify:CR=1 FL=1